MPYVLLLLVCIAGGMATVFQSQFLAIFEQKVGLLEGVLITYGSGALVMGLIMLGLRGGNVGAWRAAPPYAYLAGVLGLVIIGSLSYAVPRLGIVAAFTVFVATQFILGAAIDHFGLLGAEVRPLTPARFLGIAVLLTGVWLVVRPQ